MRPYSAEPEIIPPGSSGKSSRIDDQSLERLASLLDDIFRIPGTNLRFGLDPIIGLIPGVGDLVSGLSSSLIIFAAWQRGLSRVTIARMVANVALDSLVGSMPLVGDLFDAAWKSNRKNLNLLQRDTAVGPRRPEWHDWLFLIGIMLVVALLIMIPIALVWWLISMAKR
jgi:hypothetical protein